MLQDVQRPAAMAGEDTTAAARGVYAGDRDEAGMMTTAMKRKERAA